MGKKQYLFHQIKIRCKIHVHKGVIITNETDWLKSGVVGRGYNCKTYIEIKTFYGPPTHPYESSFIPSFPIHPRPPPTILGRQKCQVSSRNFPLSLSLK